MEHATIILAIVLGSMVGLYLVTLGYHAGTGLIYKTRNWALFQKRRLSNEQKIQRESGCRVR